MDLEQENAALKARVAELEEGLRTMRKGLVNLITIIREYGVIFSQAYAALMGKGEAKAAAEGLLKKYDFGKGN